MPERPRRLDHVGLTVADLAAAEAWYADGLRLRRASWRCGVDPLDLDIVMLIHPEHGDRLELLHRPGSRPGLRAGRPGRGGADRGRSGTSPSTCATSTRPSTALVGARRPAGDDAAAVAGAGRADGLRRRPRGQPRRAPRPLGRAPSDRRPCRADGRSRRATSVAAARGVHLAGRPDDRRLPARAPAAGRGPRHEQRRGRRDDLGRPGRASRSGRSSSAR